MEIGCLLKQLQLLLRLLYESSTDSQQIPDMVLQPEPALSTNLVSDRHKFWRSRHKQLWRNCQVYRLILWLKCNSPRYQPSEAVSWELGRIRCRYLWVRVSGALAQNRICQSPCMALYVAYRFCYPNNHVAPARQKVWPK